MLIELAGFATFTCGFINKRLNMKEKEEVKTILLEAQDELDEYTKIVLNTNNFRNLPAMSVNPFRVTLNDTLKINYVKDGNAALIRRYNITDEETGEVISNARSNITFQRRQYVDKQEFIKIYNEGLERIFNLKSASIKVFGYFMNEMQNTINADFVYFDRNKCQKFCKWNGHRLVYEGLTELIKNLIVCKTDEEHKYWINPRFVFNGNRIIIFDEFIKTDDDYFQNKKSLK